MGAFPYGKNHFKKKQIFKIFAIGVFITTIGAVSNIHNTFFNIANYYPSKDKNLYGFRMQLGYKSTGYALGEMLDKGLIVRGGLTFKLGNNSQ